MKKVVILAILCLFILVPVFIPEVSAQNILDQLFAPLAGLDIARAYDKYSTVWDLAIYLVIFVGIAKVTLGKMFGENRGGRAIVTGVGIVLAISLVLMERQMGWSLRSFGPVAAGIFTILIGITIFQGLQRLTANRTLSSSATVVMLYFSMRAVSPNIFDWMQKNEWTAFLHSILLIAVFIALFQGVRALFPRSEEAMRTLARKVKQPVETARDLRLPKEEKQEKAIIRSRLERITKKEMKESKKIIRDLQEIMKITDEHGGSAEGRRLISQKIADIVPREHEATRLLAALKDIDTKLMRFDLRVFESLRERYRKLPDNLKKKLRITITEQRAKLGCEEKLRYFEKKIEEYDKDFTYSLKMVIVNLNAGKTEDSKKWINEAIRYEYGILRICKQMKVLEDLMIKITKREFREFKKLRK